MIRSPRNWKLSRVFAGLFLTGGIAATHATTYYVDGTNGNDSNAGTSTGAAFKTCAKGFSMLAPGNTLKIAGNNTYSERNLGISSKTGTSSAPIVIDAYNTNGDPNQRPIIQGPHNPVISGSIHGIGVSHSAYVTVRNLRVWYQDCAGVEMDSCDNCTTEFCETDFTGSSGIRSTASTNITVRYNTVKHAVHGGYQECITLDNVQTFSIYGNYVGLRNSNPPTGDGGEGIDTKVGSSNGSIYNNVIDQICRMNIYTDAWDQNASNIDIYRNVCQNGAGDGLVTAMENGNTSVTLRNVRIFNNVCTGVKSGVYFNGGGGGSAHQVDGTKVYHNTFDSVSNGIYFSNGQATNTTMEYNVAGPNCGNSYFLMVNSNTPTAAQLPAGTLCFNNLGTKGWIAHFGGNNINSDPLFTNAGGTPMQYMLQSTSPAIGIDTDAGGAGASFITMDFNTQDRGSLRDAGAYEFVPATTTLKYEAEKLVVPRYWSQAGGAVRNLGPDSGLSNSDGIILDSNNVNDYVVFTVPGVAAKTYDVRVGVKKFPSRGVFQLSAAVAGASNYGNIGSPVDEYASGAAYTEVDLGNWTPATTSDKWFRFLVMGKNASSSGSSYNYAVAVDYIKLIPQ